MGRWEHSEAVLFPVYLTHSRAQHSERRALLQITERLLADGPPKQHPTGTVRLYAVHTPCVSCLAVFCQFRALFPRVRLLVAFATWQETRAQLVSWLARQPGQAGRVEW